MISYSIQFAYPTYSWSSFSDQNYDQDTSPCETPPLDDTPPCDTPPLDDTPLCDTSDDVYFSSHAFWQPACFNTTLKEKTQITHYLHKLFIFLIRTNIPTFVEILQEILAETYYINDRQVISHLHTKHKVSNIYKCIVFSDSEFIIPTNFHISQYESETYSTSWNSRFTE